MTGSLYGLSEQGYIPVRKDPYERSEMVSQVLFGEYVTILDEEGKWLYIKILFDGYEGWIDKKCLAYPVENITNDSAYFTVKNTTITYNNDQSAITLPIGSVIPDIRDNSFMLNGIKYKLQNMEGFCKAGQGQINDFISWLIGVPYIWGGRSGFGFDCSGLTQFLCRVNGKKIPRDSGEQAAMGKTIDLSESKSGDLAFFDNTEGLISHVGIIINENSIIHASGRVRCDKIDQQGIYIADSGDYTHKLRVIKRI